MKRDAGRELFGRLWAAGLLIGGPSGLCSGGVLLILLASAVAAVAGGAAAGSAFVPQVVQMLALPLVIGGLPMGVGGAAVLASGPVAGWPPRRRLGWAGVAVAALILVGTTPSAIVQLTQPRPFADHEFSLIGPADALISVSAIFGALVLLAAAIYELRRKPPQPSVDFL